jgi:hypothetical protein
MTAKYQKRKKQEAERYRKLYAAVVKHLDGWSIHMEGGEIPAEYRYFLTDAAGHGISMRRDNRPGKIRVRGHWPKYPDDENGSRFSSHSHPAQVNESAPEICATETRGPEAIAREIKRRFLPGYFRIWSLLQTRIIADIEIDCRKRNNLQRVLDSTQIIKPYSLNQLNRVGIIHDGSYGSVWMDSPDSVRLELRSLPVEVACAVLKTLEGFATGLREVAQ